jgi:DNA (cytosine-5)-methyltransferase 1
VTTLPAKFGGPIPVVDLFAGPGGLNEGFSSAHRHDGRRAFEVRLSIERDFYAHRTLELRSFFRKLRSRRVPEAYYDFLRRFEEPEESRRSELFAKFPSEAACASAETWLAELGKQAPRKVHERLSQALGRTTEWVLIGGPPCQAYSLVGRARNRGNPDYVPEKDERQTLYLEYIQVVADHLPAVFVMENVKGLLSATLNDQRIFQKIVEDLQFPADALKRAGRQVSGRIRDRQVLGRYQLVSLVDSSLFQEQDVRRFVVRMEDHGIPQARHRLIILGIREDLLPVKPGVLRLEDRVPIARVIDRLPHLRSGLSHDDDSFEAWAGTVLSVFERGWFGRLASRDGALHSEFVRAAANLTHPRADRGGEFVPWDPVCDYEPGWFLDRRMGGVCNHATRAHIPGDLQRYLYASCYAKAFGRSPTLGDFPVELLPNHENARNALDGGLFADRFRVQLRNRPATTVTSHISKDGHYYIHYDPTQCRSLTVREAARIQTFPDNYFFCGPRTAQYAQVGNAVPPLLAVKVAEIVERIFNDAGLVS